MRLTIGRLGHQGDGVAEGPVFVPRTLPGEVVEGEVTAGRMEAPAIVTPSADRRRAPCPHYAACGGCALCQHRDHRVAGWGRSICRDNHLRSFPKCTKDGRAPAFLLDEERLKQEIERERANGHR